jgi:hypothetical protein
MCRSRFRAFSAFSRFAFVGSVHRTRLGVAVAGFAARVCRFFRLHMHGAIA